MGYRKFIFPLILFLIGIAFYIIASLFKILHWEIGFLNGSVLIIVASFLQLLAIIMVIIKLISYRNSK